jgi:iron complex transport system substrate-binding protein
MLFAIGAGNQVVAVDDQSTFPANAPKTDLSGYTPNVEAISTYKPDLVVISGDTKDLKAGLEKIGVKVLIQPAAITIDDTYKELEELGDLTGHRSEADAQVATIKKGLTDAVKDLPARTTPLTYYYELDNTLFTVTSTTFIGSLFTLAKLDNVADPADPNGSNGGYPQLSAEFLVQANPDLVFLADTKCCQQNETTFAARPGFAGLKAATQHHVISLDDDVASRWGPRVVDLLQTIVAAVKSVPIS